MDSENMHLDMQPESPDVSTQPLEEMFHHNLKLSNVLSDEKYCQSVQDMPVSRTEENKPPVKYSISQHYTHSAHTAPSLHPLQPSKHDLAAHVLIKNGISPSALLRSQMALFEQAEDDQRSRLIELWRIVPPSYGRNGGQALADKLGEYQTTTMAQEEGLAWLGYQRHHCSEAAPLIGNYYGEASSQDPQLLARPSYPSHSTDLDNFPETSGSWAKGVCQEPLVRPHGRPDQMGSQPPERDEMQDEEML